MNSLDSKTFLFSYIAKRRERTLLAILPSPGNFLHLSASIKKAKNLKAAVKTDPELVHDLLHNDHHAFAMVYERYKHALYAYCERILNNSSDAEDAVQDTFLKVRSEIATLQNPALFKQWLFRIARNEALMKIRKRRFNGQVNEENVWDETTPHDRLVSLEMEEVVQRLLLSLKHDYREALILREYENLSYAEIAEIVSATEGAVKMRIFKARSALTDKLKEYYH